MRGSRNILYEKPTKLSSRQESLVEKTVTKENGSIVTEYRHKYSGEPHNDDGPAWIKERHTGATIKIWYQHGKRHREDAPAWVANRSSGIVEEIWYKEDVAHREDGPTHTETKDGKVIFEQWTFKGDLHNSSGPACIRAGEEDIYALDGKQYSKEKWQEELNNRK